MTATASICRALLPAALLLIAAFASSCGGGGRHQNSIAASGSNVQPIVVNSGPANNYANGVFTSVTVCVPATSNCQTISGILVDTGSFGLRLLSSAGGGALTLSLPQQNASNGAPLGECLHFVTAFTWGPVKSADITIAGENAGNVPVQVIDPSFSAVPAGCSNGVKENDTLTTLGANGILGIGAFVQDCGGACTLSDAQNPGLYYSCTGTSCQVAAVPLTQQVQNPVALFANDNNGVIIELPSLSNPAPSLNGSLVFGISTQSNNGLGSAAIYPINSSAEFSTTFKGQSYPAFIDSGSNALFFLNAAATGLTVCADNPGFYCPASTTNLSATTASGGSSATVNFTVSNADSLFSSGADFVFGTLAGPNSGTFDWGLPFFFGRNVSVAFDGTTTPAGAGPFWAY